MSDRKKKLREQAAKQARNAHALNAARNKERTELLREHRVKSAVPTYKCPPIVGMLGLWQTETTLSVGDENFKLPLIYGQRGIEVTREGVVFPCGRDSHIVVSYAGNGNVSFETHIAGSDLPNTLDVGFTDYVSSVRAVVQKMLDMPATEQDAGDLGKAIKHKGVWYSETGSDISTAAWVPHPRFWRDDSACLATEDNEIVVHVMLDSFAIIRPKTETYADSIDVYLCDSDLYVFRDIIDSDVAMADVYAQIYVDVSQAVQRVAERQMAQGSTIRGRTVVWHDAPDNPTGWIPFGENWPVNNNGERKVLQDPLTAAKVVPVGKLSYFYVTDKELSRHEYGELRLRGGDQQALEEAHASKQVSEFMANLRNEADIKLRREGYVK